MEESYCGVGEWTVHNDMDEEKELSIYVVSGGSRIWKRGFP